MREMHFVDNRIDQRLEKKSWRRLRKFLRKKLSHLNSQSVTNNETERRIRKETGIEGKNRMILCQTLRYRKKQSC